MATAPVATPPAIAVATAYSGYSGRSFACRVAQNIAESTCVTAPTPVYLALTFSCSAASLPHSQWLTALMGAMALPIVFCMTLVQFCFGLLNRISPAMNLFSLGFPMAIIAGLTLIHLTLPNLSEAYLHLTRELLGNIGQILRSGPDV